MKVVTSRGLLILVTFSLIISTFASVGMTGDVQASGPTYTPHSTIQITSNNDLLTLRSSGGCTGSGTANDPYVINGYDISGTGGACIFVGGITVRLVISNNYLHGNSYGVQVERSNYVTVTNNNCSDNVRYGIYLYQTGNATLTNNVCINDIAHGIYTYASSDSIIRNNTCQATKACALMLAESSNRNVVSKNTCYSSGDNGIFLYRGSNYNTISNNTLKNNRGHAIHLGLSNYNNVYGNVMIGNNRSTSVFNALHPQCADNGTGNRWSTASYGNYWADWTTPDVNRDGIIDKPYWVPWSGQKDSYPLATTNIPGPTVPGVPTALTADAGDGQVGLTWTAPGSNGGAAIDYYIIYRGGADVGHPTTTVFTNTGLTNGVTYTYTVAAHNSAGTGLQSSSVSSTPRSVPNIPSGLSATPGNAQVALSWNAPSTNGGASIDHYIVYQDGADVAHPTSTSIVVTGLTNGVTYTFTVAAHNAAGTGPISIPGPSTPFTSPGTPTGLTAIPGDGRVSLSWSAPSSNGGADIDYYIVYQNGADVKHSTSTSTAINGLTNDLTYAFTVAAHNAAGTGPRTSSVSSTPNPALTVPDAPTNLMATTGNSLVSLSWIEPGSDGGVDIDYYIVYQNGADVKHPTSTSVTIAGLANGQTYSFMVAAHNSVGLGPNSESDIVGLIGVAITSPAKSANLNTANVMVTWTIGGTTSGIASTEMSTDKGTWTIVAGTSQALYLLADGSHTVSIKVTDSDGNWNETSVSFKIDTVVPSLIITSPTNGVYLRIIPVTVQWVGSDIGSGIGSYAVKLDSGAWTALSSTASIISYTTLSQGLHTVSIVATDMAGNAMTVSVSFTADTVAPTLSITSPAQNAYFKATSVVLKWVGSDSSGIASYAVKRDSGGWTTFSSTASIITYTSLPQGPHTVSIVATDKAGNTVSVSVSFTVDTIAPTLTITSPAQNAYIGATSVTVNWAGSDTGSGIASYAVKLDSGAWKTLSKSVKTNTFTGLSLGTHTVTVMATDMAGNAKSVSVTFRV